MERNTTSEAPVVIAGAGPAGLTAAITLARYGVECLVVDRRAEPSTLPKATVVSVRNMELLRTWNLRDEVLAGADDVEWRLLVCRTLAEASAGQAFEVGYPSTQESSAVSPCEPVCVPQDHLETVLREHVKTLPNVALEVGVDVVDVHQSVDGCDVELRDCATGTARSVAARYVIGADGAHGVVRERAGIGIATCDDEVEVISVVFHAPLWDIAGDHRHGIYTIMHPSASGTLLPAGQRDRWICGFQWDPSTERLADYTTDRLVERIRIASGCADLPVRITRVGSFSFAGALADRFRNGRVFLAGDAAHRVTPRGGTGMNTAIAGAFDLGWKLGWVMNGWAPEALLDTYEAEHRPVAEHNLARSLDRDGSRRAVLDELNVDLGGRIRHLWTDAGAADCNCDRTSTVDLVGPGLTMFTGPGRTTCPEDDGPATLYDIAPVTTVELDAMVARGLGITRGGGLLVRPDGVPVRSWNHLESVAVEPEVSATPSMSSCEIEPISCALPTTVCRVA